MPGRKKRVAPRRRRNVRRKKGGRRRGKKMSKIQSITLRTPDTIMPDRLFTKLRFIDSQNVKFYASATVNGFRYLSNAAFDIDPTISGTSMAGFNEMGAFYQRYRVHASKMVIRLCNLDPINPAVVWSLPLNTDPGIGIIRSQAQAFIMNPFSKSRVISAMGGSDRTILKNYISTKKLVGAREVDFDIAYSASIAANPSLLTWWSVGAYTMDANNWSAGTGVAFEFVMTQYIEFYERKVLAT